MRYFPLRVPPMPTLPRRSLRCGAQGRRRLIRCWMQYCSADVWGLGVARSPVHALHACCERRSALPDPQLPVVVVLLR